MGTPAWATAAIKSAEAAEAEKRRKEEAKELAYRKLLKERQQEAVDLLRSRLNLDPADLLDGIETSMKQGSDMTVLIEFDGLSWQVHRSQLYVRVMNGGWESVPNLTWLGRLIKGGKIVVPTRTR